MVEGCEQWELDSKETKDREDNIADKRQPLSYIITQDIVIRSVFSNKLTTNQEAVFLGINITLQEMSCYQHTNNTGYFSGIYVAEK